jgi:DNA-binding NarL/FixJ family response regulator
LIHDERIKDDLDRSGRRRRLGATRMSAARTRPDAPVRVVLVEDSLPVRHRLRQLLEEHGRIDVVGEAATLRTAREVIHAESPDAIVLDLSLDDGDGSALLAEVKRASPARTVIVLTNNASDSIRDHCLALGADHFLVKARDFELVPALLADLTPRPPAR